MTPNPTPLSIVYVLSNPAMPGLIKIGRTSQDDARSRIDQLYSTGVPVPFELKFACKVPNSEEVERALHLAFAPWRVNPRREFFRMEADQAIAILKLLHEEDATAEVALQPSTLDSTSQEAGVMLRRMRPRMDFVEMGMEIGDAIVSRDGVATVHVATPTTVTFEDEVMSLMKATQIVFNISHNVQSSRYWTHNGRSLRDIYEETYSSTD